MRSQRRSSVVLPLAAVATGLALLTGCSTRSAGQPTQPQSPQAATSATSLAVQPPVTIMTSALSAVRAAGSVRTVAHTRAGSKVITFIDDISATAGREVIRTNGGGQATVLLVAGVGYMRGNVAALENYYALPAAAATKLSGRWISFSQSDHGYQSLTSQLRFPSFIDEITLGSPLTRSSSSVVDSQPVIGVQGALSVASGAPSGSTGTLYVASTGRPLPLSLIYHLNGIRSQVTFSNWGEAVDLTPPAHSAPASSVGLQ